MMIKKYSESEHVHYRKHIWYHGGFVSITLTDKSTIISNMFIIWCHTSENEEPRLSLFSYVWVCSKECVQEGDFSITPYK